MPSKETPAALPEDYEAGAEWLAETTLGRVLFNELLPEGYPFVNEELPRERQAMQVVQRSSPSTARCPRGGVCWTG